MATDRARTPGRPIGWNRGIPHWDPAYDQALRAMVALGARQCDIAHVTGRASATIARRMARLGLDRIVGAARRNPDSVLALRRECERLWRPVVPDLAPALLRAENGDRHRDWIARQRLVGPAPWEAHHA